MKKLFALGFLSLAALGLATEQASAWWPCFPLFNCDKCSSCTTTIKLRQFNAFTPICSGSLYCDGCAPMSLSCCRPGMDGPALFGPNCMQNCYGGFCAANGDAACLGQLPAPMGANPMPMSVTPAAPNAAPAWQPPQPAPVPTTQPTSWNMMYQRPMYYPVQPVMYRPMYYPAYAPMMPSTGAAPYYWGANGR